MRNQINFPDEQVSIVILRKDPEVEEENLDIIRAEVCHLFVDTHFSFIAFFKILEYS